MKRTTSGGDLSHSSLFSSQNSATPYVYMAASSSSTAPMTPAKPLDDPSVFRRHCGGATAKQLHVSGAVPFAFPPGFDIIVNDGFLSAVAGSEPLFAVPLKSICRTQLTNGAFQYTGLWSLLSCACCYGDRQKVLLLDIDAPLGWLQWEQLAGRGLAGPVRLGLHVVDAEEYVDAMGLPLE